MQILRIILFIITGLTYSLMVSAQELSSEQKSQVEAEQQKLKEGKISYEEYQKRYQTILSGQEAVIDFKTDSISSGKSQSQSAPASAQVSPPNNNRSSTSVTTKPVYPPGGSPGDQLIKFTNRMYTGIAFLGGGSLLVMVGANVIMATAGGSGAMLFLTGFASTAVGIIYTINSFKYIKRAGQLLNAENNRQTTN